jgi:hypothetical protein
MKNINAALFRTGPIVAVFFVIVLATFTPRTRFIVTGHEAWAHGTCGGGLCAVDLENKMRDSIGLPQRSGSDHERNPNEQPRAGNQVPPTQATIVSGPELIPTPGPPPPTFIVPKPPRKPPEHN